MTPETDAKASDIIGFFSCATVPAEFARQLERERDQAREALENYIASTVHSCNDECKRPMCVLRRERDEARKKIKTPDWIPVAQALPDDDATVLIHLADGGVEAGFLDAGAWRFVSGDRTATPVLHWRPFPDAPKPSK